MLLFAHAGITLGAGILLDKLLIGSEPFSSRLIYQAKSPNKLGNYSAHDCPSANRISLFTSVKNRLDYRFLLVGSLLPDLIDKPVGNILFYSTFQNSRIFGHTLCFNVLLAILGLYLYKSREKTWLLVLSFGSALHLIQDEIWHDLETFFWPVYGLIFPRVDTTNFFGWLPEMFHELTTDVRVYVPELIGLAILGWFMIRLVQEKRVYAFITKGVAF